mmetsp:Transcript_5456/g.16728  ORF Transcript_5456/g.16728 Transcript_5456/m.16728 type:complete len:465 (+) Transcript_5456:2198-3592(+)|eukprot:scaffold284112_cov28-Tisochrysis_lutea.AAC.7
MAACAYSACRICSHSLKRGRATASTLLPLSTSSTTTFKHSRNVRRAFSKSSCSPLSGVLSNTRSPLTAAFSATSHAWTALSAAAASEDGTPLSSGVWRPTPSPVPSRSPNDSLTSLRSAPRGRVGPHGLVSTAASPSVRKVAVEESPLSRGVSASGVRIARMNSLFATAARRRASSTHAASLAPSQRRSASRAIRSAYGESPLASASAAASHSASSSSSVGSIPKGDASADRAVSRAACACSAALFQPRTTAFTASSGAVPPSCSTAASVASHSVADSPGGRAPKATACDAMASQICARIVVSTAAVSVRARAADASKLSSSRIRTCTRNSSQPPSMHSFTTIASSCARVSARYSIERVSSSLRSALASVSMLSGLAPLNAPPAATSSALAHSSVLAVLVVATDSMGESRPTATTMSRSSPSMALIESKMIQPWPGGSSGSAPAPLSWLARSISTSSGSSASSS